MVAGLLVAGGVHAEVSPAAVDSTAAKLPFLATTSVDEFFTASNLTRLYGKDLVRFMSPQTASARYDLAALDHYGTPSNPQWVPPPLTPDSSISLTDEQRRRHPSDMTPEDRAALKPPEAGVHVGIPSAVAATTAFVGGLALLVKILAEMVR